MTFPTHATPSYSIDVSSEATFAITTTPSVSKPEVINEQRGIAYNATTGVFTFPRSDVYNITFYANPETGGNGTLYSYAETSVDGGTTWTPRRQSGRQFSIQGSVAGQIASPSSNYFEAGTLIRFMTSVSANRNLASVVVPNTSNAVVVQSLRIMISSL